MKYKGNKTRRYSQGGLASIVVVFIIIVVISLMSLGFARLMDRATRQATSNNLGAAADFAALSGVNQTSAYIKGHINDATPVSSSTCRQLLDVPYPNGLGNLNDLSGNGNVEYTCVLVDPTVDDLLYKPLPAYRSQVTKLKTSSPMGRLMVSWQSSERSFVSVPDAGTTTLMNETAWGQNQPMLKITLYAIPANNLIASVTTKTFYLYPNNKPGTAVDVVSYGSPDGSTLYVDCNSRGTIANLDTTIFKGIANYQCNLIINSMPAAAYYYAQLTPLYGSADVKLQANDAAGTPNKVQFSGVQYLVDVTAKANNAVKRLQARIDTGGDSTNINPYDNAIPEYALRTPNTICKRATIVGGVVTPAGLPCNVNYGTSGLVKLTVQIAIKGGASGDRIVDATPGPIGKINCPGNCASIYSIGTVITLKALLGAQNHTVTWNGGCSSSGLTCTVTMDTTKTVKVQFDAP